MFDLLKTFVTPLVGTSALISHVIFVGIILALLVDTKFRFFVYRFVSRYVLELLTFVSGVALVGSLVYSQIVGFPPCELCWVQRIFMYPQTLLAFHALYRKDTRMVEYLLPLSILGALVAFYHSLVQWGFNVGSGGCVAVGGECAKVYVDSYGYITIPFMAFTVFAYLILFSIVYFLAQKKFPLSK